MFKITRGVFIEQNGSVFTIAIIGVIHFLSTIPWFIILIEILIQLGSLIFGTVRRIIKRLIQIKEIE